MVVNPALLGPNLEDYERALQERFITPPAATGLAGVTTSTADPLIQGTPEAAPERFPALQPVGLSVGPGYDPSQFGPSELRPARQLPEPLPTPYDAPAQPQLTQPVIAYSPSTNKLVVNGRVADASNAVAVAEIANFIGATPTPAPGKNIKDWQAVSPSQLTGFVEALKKPRGTLENIKLGLSTATESLVGGAGRIAETQFGAPETGRAIAGFAKEQFGLTPEQESRNALIQQSNTFAGNLLDAVESGGGSLFVSVLGGLVGGGLAGLVTGGPVGMAVGAGLGAATFIFPMEMYGLFDAAKKNGYNVEDPEVQNTMLYSAGASTIIQSALPGYAGKALAPAFRAKATEIARQKITEAMAKRTRLKAAGAIALGGLTEAFAEGTAQFVQSVVFDKELRAKLDPEQEKYLLNYLAAAVQDPLTYKKYGLDLATAALAGGILGAGVTAGVRGLQRGAIGSDPVDVTKRGDTEQIAGLLPPPQPPEVIVTPPGGPAAPAPLQIEGSQELKLLPPPQPSDVIITPPGEPPAPAPLQLEGPQGAKLLPPPQGYVSPGGPVPDVIIPPPGGPAAPAPLAIAGPRPGEGLPLFEVAPYTPPPSVTPTVPRTELFEGLPEQRPPAPPELPTTGQQQVLPLGEYTVQPSLPFYPTADEVARARAEADYDRALAQVAAQRYPDIDPETVRAGKKGAAKAKFVEDYNSLSQVERARFLANFDNVDTSEDFANLVSGVNKFTVGATRRRLNDAAQTIGRSGLFQVTTSTDKGAALKKGASRATTQGTEPASDKPERAATPQGGQTTKTSGRDSLTKSRKKPQTTTETEEKVTPATTETETDVEAPLASKESVQAEFPPDTRPMTDALFADLEEGTIADSDASTLAAYIQEEIETARGKKVSNELYNTILENTYDALPTALKKTMARDEFNSQVFKKFVRRVQADILKETQLAVDIPATRTKLLSDFDNLVDATDLDGKLLRPMAIGRVRMDVKNFVRKLARKPKVSVYANQAELKLKAPELYKRAAASRPGDFDTAPAAAISFGDEIIVFSDRIATPKMLRFVMAHESLGHFGMRSIIPAKDFNALMENIYDQDSRARQAADARMSQDPEMSKAEAVEEYLSDYAASLDVSLVYRLWNGIKKFLSKLGMPFDDGTTRYLLDQARRYTRDGIEVNAAQLSKIAERADYIERGADAAYTGRYHVPPELMKDQQRIGHTLRFEIQIPRTLADMVTAIRQSGFTSAATWRQFKNTYLSLTAYTGDKNEGALLADAYNTKITELQRSIVNRINERLTEVFKRDYAGNKELGALLFNARDYIENVRGTRIDLDKIKLVRIRNGVAEANPEAVEALIKEGSLTLDEIKDGFDITVELDKDGNAIRPVYPKPEKKDDEPKPVKVLKREVKGIANIKKDSQIWKDYMATRRAVAESAVELAVAKHNMATETRKVVMDDLRFKFFDGKEIPAGAQEFIDTYERIYTSLLGKMFKEAPDGTMSQDKDAKKVAEDFLIAVNAAIIGKDVDRVAALRQFKGVSPADANAMADLVVKFRKAAGIKEGKQGGIGAGVRKFALQKAVRQIAEIVVTDLRAGDRHAIRTIANGYIPIIRKGKVGVRIQAYKDAAMTIPVALPDSVKEMMVYSQVETEGEADALSKQINEQLGTEGYKDVPTRGPDGTTINETVYVRAESYTVNTQIAVAPTLNLNEFMRGLRQFGVALNPKAMENIITALTKQNESAARRSLRASFTPGYDPAIAIQSLSEHVTTEASLAARITYQAQVNDLMNLSNPRSIAKWLGDSEGVINLYDELQALKKAAKPNQDAIRGKERELTQALYRFTETRPAYKGWDGSRKNFKRTSSATDRGYEFYNLAAQGLELLSKNKHTDELDFFTSNKTASWVMGSTALAQLGGSLAQGVLNLTAVPNWIAYASTYNSKSGFGGGFGTGRATSEVFRAMRQTGAGRILDPKILTKFDTAEFYLNIAKDAKLQKKYGFTKTEAEVIAQEIRTGILSPAQSNAVLSHARGFTTGPLQRKMIDYFILPFNRTEQLVRRGAFLAGYRMFYNRFKAEGMSEADATSKARDEAVRAIRLTVGDYTLNNRPVAWRGGLTSFLYMYKIYPTTTVQLLRNLDRKGQIGMLAALWLLTGVTGLPFAEDAEDVIDTVAQKLGFSTGSIRVEISRVIEDIAPGMSPVFFKGLMNEMFPTPADIAARTSLGNLIPGTGIAVAGEDPMRALSEVAGPAMSFLTGLGQMGADLATYPFSDKKTISDIARESPVTLMRMLGDTYQYQQNGAIVDRRGYVVSPDVTLAEMMTRLAGFYPKSAAKQYEMIKYTKRITNYQKEMVAGFRIAWIKARLTNDFDRARSIEEDVRAWNDLTRGTPMEIRNFLKNSNKALREARRPAGERALRATAASTRQSIDAFVAPMIGVD